MEDLCEAFACDKNRLLLYKLILSDYSSACGLLMIVSEIQKDMLKFSDI